MKPTWRRGLILGFVALWPLVAWGHDGKGSSGWSASYRRSLPDEAFAVIEVTADGRTLRRLPHHDHTGQLDIPHLRSALGRVSQVTWVDPSNAQIAKSHLAGHLREYRRAALGRKLQLSLPLHVNTAPVDELARLPGLGKRRAARIIAHREAHGPFESIDQLARVPGMRKVPLHRIRDFLTTE
ncbi:MAG: helix-hairpin-helix domain-containing protein [Nitrospinae bacterium]|nr:helix-hairpin-helix domain-containing protein [Nitrospinota bacterium]